MSKYDWKYYRDRYVAEDISLEQLSRLSNSPALSTLKNRSRHEDWPEQRQRYKDQVKTKTRELASTEDAEVAARHIKIAKSLQNKAIMALQTLDPNILKPTELLKFFSEAVRIERDALGFADRTTVEIVSQYKDEDLSRLSDEELEALWAKMQRGNG